MMARRPRSSYLPIEEVSPTVDLADCWKYEVGMACRYCVPSHHLLLVESGRIRAQPPRDEFDAVAGDLICFRPAEVNRYRIVETAVFYQAHLEFAAPPLHERTPLLGEHGPVPVLASLGERFEPMRRVFETLCMEVSQPGVVHKLRLRTAVWELLTLVTEAIAARAQPQSKLDNWDRLRQRLDANLHRGVKIAALAREMRISPSYLILRFKRRFGLSPKAYLTQARLREAARLLRATELPVKSIAFDLGFPSVKAFERLFKHHTGRRPLEARSQPLFTGAPVPATPLNPFQMNQYNVRPGRGPDWMDKYRIAGERTADLRG